MRAIATTENTVKTVTFGKYTYTLTEKTPLVQVSKDSPQIGSYMRAQGFIAIWNATRDGMNFTTYEHRDGSFGIPVKINR